MNNIDLIRKIVIFVGGFFSLVVVFFNLYHALGLESVMLEIIKTLIIAGIFLFPAFALWKKKETNLMLTKIGVLYPILVALGFMNILVSQNQAEAALPMIFIVVPFCVIYGVVVLVKGK